MVYTDDCAVVLADSSSFACHFTLHFGRSQRVSLLLGVGTSCTNRWKTVAMTLGHPGTQGRALQGTYSVQRGYIEYTARPLSLSTRSLWASHPTKTVPQPFSVVCSAEYFVPTAADSVLILLSHTPS